MAELEDAFIDIMKKVPADGVGHLVPLPATNLAECPDPEAVERRMQAINPSYGRIFRVRAEVDGTVLEHAFVVGTMIVPAFASFDSANLLHPMLRLTLSPYYPSVITYVETFFKRRHRRENNDMVVRMLDLQLVN